MITKEQALSESVFHYIGEHPCSCTVGPKGGRYIRITSVRRSGATQIWKRSPERFRVPVKYGLYESSAITEQNAHLWHTEADCPVGEK